LLENPFFGLFLEMGMGKSKVVIDAAQVLFVRGVINRVIVVAPAGVRRVWYDPEFGQLRQHLWKDLPALVTEYHAKRRQWTVEGDPKLRWIVTNYEFIGRSPKRLAWLLQYCDAQTLLVLDESSYVAHWNTQQTKACRSLRARAGRVIELNGTPTGESPLDLFSQANLLHPSILQCPSETQFKARYAMMTPLRGKLSRWGQPIQIVTGWHHQEDLSRRLAPYVLRRMKSECLDLPDKLPTVPMFPELTPQTWALYRDMRDECVAWLRGQASMSPQAVTKLMRLAQITSGFLGGLANVTETSSTNPDDWDAVVQDAREKVTRAVGREKLDFTIEWVKARIVDDPHFKLLIWSPHRAEILRTARELAGFCQVGTLIGNQEAADRARALQLLDPRTAPDGPVVVVGNPASGGLGVSLTAAHTVLYMANSWRLLHRLQSEDRVHRPGQHHAVSYFDLLAIGPNGQKTIDHAVFAALAAKHTMGERLTAPWIQALQEDYELGS
jgi:hypothetical protein